MLCVNGRPVDRLLVDFVGGGIVTAIGWGVRPTLWTLDVIRDTEVGVMVELLLEELAEHGVAGAVARSRDVPVGPPTLDDVVVDLIVAAAYPPIKLLSSAISAAVFVTNQVDEALPVHRLSALLS